ncbi:MAG: transcription elongation factor GreA [Candidatus Pacebacteria bacterium]|nr:transcription elongation factor GreA [Candidatus Paceibacterota bacterium]
MKEYLTKKKYKELEEELGLLKTTRRQEVATALKEARSLGDLSENAEYHQAREDQANIEKRIEELEIILKDVEIVRGDVFTKVEVGANVVVQKSDSKTSVEYLIVGSQEANMAENKISISSPLVQAMLGKKKGELFSFKSPKSEQSYKIINIK